MGLSQASQIKDRVSSEPGENQEVRKVNACTPDGSPDVSLIKAPAPAEVESGAEPGGILIPGNLYLEPERVLSEPTPLASADASPSNLEPERVLS